MNQIFWISHRLYEQVQNGYKQNLISIQIAKKSWERDQLPW